MAEGNVPHIYPTWRFSAADALIVYTEEEWNALDGTWYDSPAKVPVQAEAPVAPVKRRRGRPPKAGGAS